MLEGVSGSLDDTSHKNIKGLRKLAEEFLALNAARVEQVCERLTANPDSPLHDPRLEVSHEAHPSCHPLCGGRGLRSCRVPRLAAAGKRLPPMESRWRPRG